jgi:hypothetical protein
VSARPLPPPVNPALLQHAKQRRQSLENRLADQITRFAGSMRFVYLHIMLSHGPVLPPVHPCASFTRPPRVGSRTDQAGPDWNGQRV